MTTYEARVRLYSYVDVKVDADDEDEARVSAIELAYETPYAEISDAEIDWIESDEEDAA
jgi:hypothetical protein